MRIITKLFLGLIYLGICLCVITIGVFHLANRPVSHMGKEIMIPSGGMSLETSKRLHKFHGTNSSYLERGKWWFERNGKKCRLWDPRDRRR